jgi:heat shock protein HtpX
LVGFLLYKGTDVFLPHVDRGLLPAIGARLVDKNAAPQVHNVVEEICISAGLEKPRIAVIDDPALNAFARKGSSPGSSIIAFTCFCECEG